MILIFAKAGEGVGKATSRVTWLWKVDLVVCEANGNLQGFAVRHAYDRASQGKTTCSGNFLARKPTRIDEPSKDLHQTNIEKRHDSFKIHMMLNLGCICHALTR